MSRDSVWLTEAQFERLTAFPTRAMLLGLTAGLPIQWGCFATILAHPKSHFATMFAASVFGAFHLAVIGGWIYYAVKRTVRRKGAA